MPTVIAILLVAEAALTALWLARLLPVLSIYPLTVTGVAVLRAATAAFEGAAGLMIVGHRPAGRPFAQRALLLSAGVLTIELGAGVVPTSVFPSYRWPIVLAYWVYAIVAVWILEKATRHEGQDR